MAKLIFTDCFKVLNQVRYLVVNKKFYPPLNFLKVGIKIKNSRSNARFKMAHELYNKCWQEDIKVAFLKLLYRICISEGQLVNIYLLHLRFQKSHSGHN